MTQFYVDVVGRSSAVVWLCLHAHIHTITSKHPTGWSADVEFEVVICITMVTMIHGLHYIPREHVSKILHRKLWCVVHYMA
jgi:hypothetical protein